MPVAATRRANRSAMMAVGLLLAVVGFLLWTQFVTARQAREWVSHTYEVLAVAKDLKIAVRDAETGQRGFLLTGRENYLQPYRDALDRITLVQGDLRRLTLGSPAQQDRLRSLASTIQHKLEELAQTIQIRRDVGPEAALRIVDTDVGRNLTVGIEAALDDVVAEEDRLLEARTTAANRAGTRTRWMTFGAFSLALCLLAFSARLLAAARDKLSRSEVEQRMLAVQLRASLDCISQGMGVFGTDHRLLRWNECFPTLLALPEAMMRQGVTYREIATWTAEVGGGGLVLETEDQIRHGRGGRATGEPVVYERTRDSDGRSLEFRRTVMPGGYVVMVTDITERVRAETSAREAQRMQAMGQLTGGIAHDFNNLLAVVLGSLELAKRCIEADSPILPRIERAIWGAKRGASLTQQLLAFARRQPLAPAPIDLSATLLGMSDLLQRTLGKHIEVQVVDAAGLWPAMVDATQVESALLNLTLNARDAMPDGGRLTIEVANKVLDTDYARQHTEVSPGDYVMLAVSDTGIGMSPEVLARVFEPFFTTKDVGKGTGLGLPMVFGFAKQSGGHVKIYSEPGEGTTVRLYLPRAFGVTSSALPRPGTPVELPRGSATVLVVEDEPSVRDITAAILRDLGYCVLEAGSGPEALRVFGESGAKLDLLLADVVLPGGMKGHEVARRVTEVRPTVRTLFMSGYTENAIVHHGRLDDGVHLIGKPFSREALACKVAEVLQLSVPAAADGKVVDFTPRQRLPLH
ncbi:CHASE3 domain-containing protein [Paracraurococcus lichenis]|uniref:histidine kinase n=1 Tax=Paracraurococcus lichenis TaxID=3064888 RepID=A0ABT9EEH2_9PROT|nr:CHASE3 domain-containing protein [Paracraurococcus sp. LOR1-02]MDO9714270.1 CHASE3 domain-containing protein [Paracraurococcus sp. LOR1-02]